MHKNQVLDRAALARVSIHGGGGFLVTTAKLALASLSAGIARVNQRYERAHGLGAMLTNWEIHGPAAAPLMRDFYVAIAAGHSVARALQLASRQAKDRLVHPYFWAAFAVIGWWNADALLTRKQ